LFGFLKRLSLLVAGLSPLVFCAWIAGAAVIIIKRINPSNFNDREITMALFAAATFKKWCQKHAKLTKIYELKDPHSRRGPGDVSIRFRDLPAQG
jgi:hypothetical protein